MRNIIKIASVFALMLALMVSLSYAQENCSEWTMDQYNAKMAELKKAEEDAKAELAATEQTLEKVAAESAELEKKFWKENQNLRKIMFHGLVQKRARGKIKDYIEQKYG